MNKNISRAIFGLSVLAVVGSASAQSWNYTDFSNPNGLQLNGDAILGGVSFNEISLYQNQSGAGTAFDTTAINASGGFTTTFQFREAVSNHSSGIAFFLNSNGPTNNSNNPNSYGDGTNGFGVIIQGDEYNQTNEIEIFRSGTIFASATETTDPLWTTNGTDAGHSATVSYVNNIVKVFLDGGSTPILATFNPNVGSINLANCYAGFGSSSTNNNGTGGINNVLSWSFTTQAVPEPGAYAILGLGVIALIKRRRA